MNRISRFIQSDRFITFLMIFLFSLGITAILLLCIMQAQSGANKNWTAVASCMNKTYGTNYNASIAKATWITTSGFSSLSGQLAGCGASG